MHRGCFTASKSNHVSDKPNCILHASKAFFAKLRLNCLKLLKMRFFAIWDLLVVRSSSDLLGVASLFVYSDANGETVEKLWGKNDFRTRLLTSQPYSARVEVAPFNGNHRRKNVSARSSSQRRLDAGPISVRFRLEWS